MLFHKKKTWIKLVSHKVTTGTGRAAGRYDIYRICLCDRTLSLFEGQSEISTEQFGTKVDCVTFAFFFPCERVFRSVPPKSIFRQKFFCLHCVRCHCFVQYSNELLYRDGWLSLYCISCSYFLQVVNGIMWVENRSISHSLKIIYIQYLNVIQGSKFYQQDI